MPKVLNPRSRDAYWNMLFIVWRNIFNSSDYHSYLFYCRDLIILFYYSSGLFILLWSQLIETL